MAEREERHKQMGNTRYVVEPNIKDGKAVCDLHTLFWIGKCASTGSRPAPELVDKGVLSAEEYRHFQRAEEFPLGRPLQSAFPHRRADEKLTFEVQPDLARRLRYADRPGMLGVERMMKRYFLVAKDVGDLTRIICTSLEFDHAKPLDMMGRVTGPVQTRPRRDQGRADFVIDSGRLNTAAPDTFDKNPLALIKSFLVAGRNDLLFHPDAIKAITRALHLINRDVKNSPRPTNGSSRS